MANNNSTTITLSDAELILVQRALADYADKAARYAVNAGPDSVAWFRGQQADAEQLEERLRLEAAKQDYQRAGGER
jgi:hypothetical protein